MSGLLMLIIAILIMLTVLIMHTWHSLRSQSRNKEWQEVYLFSRSSSGDSEFNLSCTDLDLSLEATCNAIRLRGFFPGQLPHVVVMAHCGSRVWSVAYTVDREEACIVYELVHSLDAKKCDFCVISIESQQAALFTRHLREGLYGFECRVTWGKARSYEWYMKAEALIDEFLPKLDQHLVVSIVSSAVDTNDGVMEGYALLITDVSKRVQPWQFKIMEIDGEEEKYLKYFLLQDLADAWREQLHNLPKHGS